MQNFLQSVNLYLFVLNTKSTLHVKITRTAKKLMVVHRARVMTVLNITTITNAYRNGDGGGIYVYESDLHMEDLIIENNEAFNGEGGGVSIQNSNGSILTESIIRNNLSRPRGGGLNVGNSTFFVENTIITENEIYPTSGGSGASGGGVHVDNYSEVTFTYVQITKNA